MKGTAMALASAFFAAAIGVGTAAADIRLVIDQPDVQGFHKQDTGASLSRIIGTDVYSNSGKRLGEVEDFIVAEGGYLYAVIDIQDGPLESVIELPDGDKVVVPWNELRTQSVPED